MSELPSMEEFVLACVQCTAEALGVEEQRITAKGVQADDGSIIISWQLDGLDPTDEQIESVNRFIDAQIASGLN